MLGGAKITDIFLAEKNLVDFVDKNLGQERDRLKQDELEMENLCSHMAGGSLDFPVMVSHDFCDITTSWDIYLYTFTREIREAMPKKFGFGVNEKPFEKNPRWGKIPFTGEELTQRQFANAVVMCGQKIKQHIIDCTLECTSSGRLENLYCIISNVVIIRNYIWMLQELFDSECKSKLKPEYTEFCDLVDVISEQMVQAQSNLLLTYVIHDEESQSWNSHRTYFESERGSPTVQMWAYFLKNFQRDMWRIMPPQLAQRILGTVVSESVGILAARYSKVTPTEESINQYVCDIINILATTEELLCFICSDLQVFSRTASPTVSRSIFSIHLKCSCLGAALILVGCPLEILYKTFRRGLSSCSLMLKPAPHPTQLSEPVWSELVKCLTYKFYPAKLSNDDWELLSALKLMVSQPGPVWPLVYKTVTMQDCRIGTFMLTLFPTVVAPAEDFLLEGKIFQRCGKASCILPECHSLAKTLPNHYVAASTLYILAHGTSRDIFRKVYRSVMAKVFDWTVMDRTQIWSSKSRPVWFQSMIDLLLPILKTCVQSLCLTILDMRSTWQGSEETCTHLVNELLNVLAEMLSVIPRGFFLVCEEMDDMIPPAFRPVRNNVPVHFLVTALYMLLNLGPKILYIPPKPAEHASRGKKNGDSVEVPSKKSSANGVSGDEEHGSREAFLEPVLVSVAERLCHLDYPEFDQAIHRLVTQIESMLKQMKTEPSKASVAASKGLTYETEWDVAQIRSDFLLQEVEGQLALRLAYWFIVTHGDLLQSLITGTQSSQDPPNSLSSPSTTNLQASNGSLQNQPPHQSNQHQPPTKLNPTSLQASGLKVAPRLRTYIKPANILHEFRFVNKYRLFDEIIWNYEANLDWVETVRSTNLGLQKAIALKIMERRWEFQEEDFPEEKKHIVKMTEEIRALMMA